MRRQLLAGGKERNCFAGFFLFCLTNPKSQQKKVELVARPGADSPRMWSSTWGVGQWWRGVTSLVRRWRHNDVIIWWYGADPNGVAIRVVYDLAVPVPVNVVRQARAILDPARQTAKKDTYSRLFYSYTCLGFEFSRGELNLSPVNLKIWQLQEGFFFNTARRKN